ncbi:acetyl esterase [Acinetobacter rathckeae]|uniref:acetyl esterase n=1 Tax=Acinetobacter rathckeae TaxID=2605272 RepID=UPI0018A31AB1|nr:acetyl esterase [Acinetobacter rathckeae]MBF7696709.1 acetyl esterase [Acinetobacter rathckeae]
MNMYLVTTPQDGCNHIKAMKVGDQFQTLSGEIISKSNIMALARVTPDQAEFETEYRKFEMFVDFSKHDSLVYKNSKTRSVYSLWRSAKGYSISDPEYLATSVQAQPTQSPAIYLDRKYKGD